VPDERQDGRDEHDQHGDFENDEFDLDETIAELGQLVFRTMAVQDSPLLVPGN
jgi:hypothetical protein